MKPTPARQRRQAHRRRLALRRALHQVRAMRVNLSHGKLRNFRKFAPHWLAVPKMLRKHAGLLRHTFAVLGS